MDAGTAALLALDQRREEKLAGFINELHKAIEANDWISEVDPQEDEDYRLLTQLGY